MGLFYQWLKKEMFCPSRFGMLVNSSYLIRQALGEAIQKHSGEMRGTMLDFGCGTSPYQSLFQIDRYLGLEIAAPGHPLKNTHSALLYSGDRIPLQDEFVDSILMTEVLEHVFNPAELLAEFHRVLRPGGSVLITCPFVWPLHEEPYDYARYTPFALKHLLQSADFEIVHMEKTGTWFLSVAQLLLTFAVQSLLPSQGRLHRVGKMLWCTLVNPLALLLNMIMPRNERLYFSNIIVARKPALSPLQS